MWHADRDVSGMCCPVELRSVLADSFKRTDEELLQWRESPLGETPYVFLNARYEHIRVNGVVVNR